MQKSAKTVLVGIVGIFKQSMGAIGPARLNTQLGGIGSLESILGHLKSLKIRALVAKSHVIGISKTKRDKGR